MEGLASSYKPTGFILRYVFRDRFADTKIIRVLRRRVLCSFYGPPELGWSAVTVAYEGSCDEIINPVLLVLDSAST